MHINDLGKVQQLTKALVGARVALKQAEDGVFVAPKAAPIPLPIKASTLEMFAKIVLIELAEAEQAIVDQLEALGVDAEELDFEPFPMPTAVGEDENEVPAALGALLSKIFGGAVSFGEGGVVSVDVNGEGANLSSLGEIVARSARRTRG